MNQSIRLLNALGVPDAPALRLFAADVLRVEEDGGPGSGNFGHKGRPGQRGGSGSGGGGKTSGGGAGRSGRSKPGVSKPASPAPNKRVTSKSFVPVLDAAKASCPPDTAWRVDTYRTAEDFDAEGVKVYTTDGGSTFAIKPDGDIISVCKNQDTDKGTNARDLMAAAVERGGTHLDSFDGNYYFYTKCGFEVVARCKFDKKYAPPGWDKSRDRAEDIVFMRYVGVGKVQDQSKTAMRTRVPYSSSYDEAAQVLEKAMNGGDE